MSPRTVTAVLASLAMLLSACATATPTPAAAPAVPAGPPAAAVADLAPTGTIRVAITDKPPFLAHAGGSAEYRGVAVDLARELAASLHVPYAIVLVDSPDALIDPAKSGAWDVAFLPVLPPQAAAADEAAPYLLVPHTYAVRPGSALASVVNVDQPGVKIVTVGRGGHSAVLTMRIKKATITYADDMPSALAALKSGAADALADGRFDLLDLASGPLAGYPILPDDWFVAEMTIASHHGTPAGLAYLKGFVEQAKQSGSVQRAIDATKVSGLKVAALATY